PADPAGATPARGSVFPQRLARNPTNGDTLWLEYVRDHKNQYDKLLWLIWYDRDGCPLTVASAVFDYDVARNLMGNLVTYLQIPWRGLVGGCQVFSNPPRGEALGRGSRPARSVVSGVFLADALPSQVLRAEAEDRRATPPQLRLLDLSPG